MSLNNSLKIIYPIIIGSFAALTYYIGSNQSLSNNNRGNFNQKDKLQHIMSIIENRYVDSTDKNLLIENSIIGMLEELDPHSTYIPKKKVAPGGRNYSVDSSHNSISTVYNHLTAFLASAVEM